MDHAKTLWRLINKLDWNVMLCRFPNIENGKPYRIVRLPGPQESTHEIIGWGATPKQAVENMKEQEKRGSGE
jgi:hypothetical protein